MIRNTRFNLLLYVALFSPNIDSYVLLVFKYNELLKYMYYTEEFNAFSAAFWMLFNSHRDTSLLPTAYFFIITVFHHYHDYLWRKILLKHCTYSYNIFLTHHFTPIVLIIKHKSKLSSSCYKTQTWSNFSSIILQFMQR